VTGEKRMNTTLRAGIDWVGYVDWTIRDFHGYSTRRGGTYNAYLVRDEKTALVDTVKALYADHLIANVERLTDAGKVDYIVVNHAEPDHAGSLPRAVEAFADATVVCDKKCRDTLASYHDTSGWKFEIVKTGDEISLGKRTLRFIETPMVHWPESMFTYVPEEKLLFSMDAFGQHYATMNRFDDEVNMQEVMEEAKTYYANIVMLYGKPIARTLESAEELEIEMIAPSHGVIWRSHIGEILSAYRDWVVCKAARKVLVIYDSMWGSTERLAKAILEGASAEGVKAKLLYVRSSDLTEVATEVLDAGGIAFGSSTLNMGMMPMMGAVMTYLKGLRPTGKAGLAFGSYGWGKGAAEALQAYLEEMPIEIVREPLKCQWRPDEEALAECRAAGKMLAEKAKAAAGD